MGIKRKRPYGIIIITFFFLTLNSYSVKNITSEVIINSTFLENNYISETFFSKHENEILKYYTDNQVSIKSLMINGFFSSLAIFVLNIFFILKQSKNMKKEKDFEKRSTWYKTLIVEPYMVIIRNYFIKLNSYSQGSIKKYRAIKKEVAIENESWKHLYSDLGIFNLNLAIKIQELLLESDDSLRKICFSEIEFKEYKNTIEKNEREIIKLLYEFDFKWNENKIKKN